MLLKICPFVASFLLLLKLVKSSVVIDSVSQDAIYLDKYCPKMEFCPEGSHVMCMYYNPKKNMGPRCNHPKNISMIPEIASKILDITNAIRSRIALGKEKGKGGQPLPRAYGMFKLSWDSELATFAQVMANQCQLRHDLCRATKKFPDPGQTAGLVRFSYPDWFPVSQSNPFTSSGLTMNKLLYAVQQSLKSWYGQKEQITADMIQSYPDYALHPDQQGGRLYLEMIHSSATHVGCGVSAYTEYSYYDRKTDLNFNSVELICNFSARSRKGSPVYETKPPTAIGYTVRCGCPPGTDEDANCLCFESPRINIITTPPNYKEPSIQQRSDKPAVVLLPIFTVEDAPITNIDNKLREDKMNELPKDDSAYREVFADDHTLAHDTLIQDHISQSEENSPFNEALNTTRKVGNQVKKRYFKQSFGSSEHNKRFSSKNNCGKDHKSLCKQSSFAQKTPFSLSLPHNENNIRHSVEMPIYRSDEHFTSKKHGEPRRYSAKVNKDTGPYFDPLFDENESKPKNTLKGPVYNENFNNNFVPSKYNISERQRNSYDDFDRFNEETDKKLMNLLDNLEQEVKHMDLKGPEKEIFDAKIRKIYDHAIRNTEKFKIRKVINNDYTLGKYNNKLGHSNEYDNDAENYNKKTENLKKSTWNTENYKVPQDIYKYDSNYNNYVKTIKDIDAENRNLYAGLKSSSDLIVKNPFKEKYDNSYRKTNMDILNYYGVNDIAEDRKDTKYNDLEDDLSIERRKYYQEQLNIEKMTRNPNSYRRRGSKPALPYQRPVRINTDNLLVKPAKSNDNFNPLYVPGRARYLHGY